MKKGKVIAENEAPKLFNEYMGQLDNEYNKW